MPKICIVGEAWGESEALISHPFVGASGFELLRMLDDAGVITITPEDRDNLKRRWTETPARAAQCVAKVWFDHSSEIALTNVFNLRPKGNDIDDLCTDKAGDRLNLPPIRAGKYIRKEFGGEIDRLQNDLAAAAPNVVVALGATAAWALLHSSGISRIRGTVSRSANDKYKVLPTYHPAAILRQWDLRPVTVLDLAKAKRESVFPEVRRPRRMLYIEPTLWDLEWFWDNHLANASIISFDIETRGEEITCIGFAPRTDIALVVPFTDNRKPGGSYWPTKEDEVKAWAFVRRVLATPIPKVGQNGAYDYTFLWKQYGIPVNNYEDDTMLLHHILQPESEKGLGFLGSVYTSEPAWKMMRSRGKETIKREE